MLDIELKLTKMWSVNSMNGSSCHLSCNCCLVVDDTLNILPISSHSFELKAVQPAPTNEELKELVRCKIHNLSGLDELMFNICSG